MLKISKSALQRSHDNLEASLREAQSEAVSLKATVSQMAADSSAIQCQLEATKVGRREPSGKEGGGWVGGRGEGEVLVLGENFVTWCLTCMLYRLRETKPLLRA